MRCASSFGDFAREMRVWATPLACAGDFTVFAVRDTSDQKRRLVLGRLFSMVGSAPPAGCGDHLLFCQKLPEKSEPKCMA